MPDFERAANLLSEHRRKLEARPLLAGLYRSWYERMSAFVPVTGRVLEVGAGGGRFGEMRPGTLSSDLVRVPWVDLVCDAQRLPLSGGSLAAIVGVDVLHHLPRPLDLLREAARVLAPGGRLVLHEPHLSLASWPVYALLHPEPVDLAFDPFAASPVRPSVDPMDGNPALPWLTFVRGRHRLASTVPGLRLLRYEPTATILYPLSGGYDQIQILPDRLAPLAERLERFLAPVARWVAYRALIVLERTDSTR